MYMSASETYLTNATLKFFCVQTYRWCFLLTWKASCSGTSSVSWWFPHTSPAPAPACALLFGNFVAPTDPTHKPTQIKALAYTTLLVKVLIWNHLKSVVFWKSKTPALTFSLWIVSFFKSLRFLTSSSMSAGLLGPVLCLLLWLLEGASFLDLLFKRFCRDEDCLFFFLGLTAEQK